MDRSNIRESISFEENEAKVNTMKTIHSLDEMYKTYVPRTEAKNDKPEPATLIFKSPNTENSIKPDFMRPLARNLAPLVGGTPYQANGICAPRVQFSYISCYGDPRNNQELNNPEVSAMHIASGQINKRGSPTCVVATNNITYTDPQPYNGSFCSQHGYYGDPAYVGYDFPGYPDQYQPQYPSNQQFATGSQNGSKRCSVNDNCFENENKSIHSNKSVCISGDKKLVNDDFTTTPSNCSAARRLSTPCQCQKSQIGSLTGIPNDTCPCAFQSMPHHFDNRTCSPRSSCGSFNRKFRRVRIASDSCSRSSQDSIRSSISRNSRCSDPKPWISTHGFCMPDPEVRMICAEEENDCDGPAAYSSQKKLTFPPMICWDGCNVGNNNNNNCQMNSCSVSSAYLNGCYLNDALQDSTVYNRDFKPIMFACNHLYQHYAGCCWKDLPLGGGCGPCGSCGSCGGYGALSNLPVYFPFIVDANRYVPPTATMDTCSRPFCDHYAEDTTKCNSGICTYPCCPGSIMERCCSITDCPPPSSSSCSE